MRRNITETLARWNAQSAVENARIEIQNGKLRAELVDKYGKDAMDRKDRQLEKENNERY